MAAVPPPVPESVSGPVPEPALPASFRAELRDTLRGVPQDYTTKGLGRSITLLAIPMVLEMVMQSVFGVVDIFFVGRLGADAVAAVGLTDSLLILVLAVGMGLNMAATALVARRVGEKDDAGAGKAAAQVLLAGSFVSVPISLVGLFFAPDLLALMGATEGVIEAGSGYCAVLFGTNAVILYLFMINSAFRGAGDAVLALKTLALANGVNIVLDPAFIFGWGPFPEMGVTGAAVATSIGRAVGILYQLSVLRRGAGRLRIHREGLRLDPAMMRHILRIAAPGVFQYLIGTASWLALFRLLALFGSDALAGYTIAIRIHIFALLPSWGLGNAAATLVGQNLGAGRPDRAERSVWLTAFTNMGFLGLVGLGLILGAEPLMRLFTDEPAVIGYGVSCLRIISYTYVFYAFGMVTEQAFNGAGDTTTPTLINLFCLWLVQIPLAYVLAQTAGLGPTGAFAGVALADALLAVVSVTFFRLGRWKRKKV